jgi:hypothetical protein
MASLLRNHRGALICIPLMTQESIPRLAESILGLLKCLQLRAQEGHQLLDVGKGEGKGSVYFCQRICTQHRYAGMQTIIIVVSLHETTTL